MPRDSCSLGSVLWVASCIRFGHEAFHVSGVASGLESMGTSVTTVGPSDTSVLLQKELYTGSDNSSLSNESILFHSQLLATLKTDLLPTLEADLKSELLQELHSELQKPSQSFSEGHTHRHGGFELLKRLFPPNQPHSVKGAAEAMDGPGNVTTTQVHSPHDRWSIEYMFVFVPLFVMSIPLFYIWRQLEATPDEEEVWTPYDTDMRQESISSMGASGVSLLRNASDRVFGIRLAFVGFLLQTVFLYFLFLDFMMTSDAEKDHNEHGAPILLLWCCMFFANVNCSTNIVKGTKAFKTRAPKGYEQIHPIMVTIDAFVMPSLTIVIGNLWLCLSADIHHLVFNATGLSWVGQVNNVIATLMQWSLSAHAGRAFVPTNVSVKDDINSMKHTIDILLIAAVLSCFMVPVSIAVFAL